MNDSKSLFAVLLLAMLGGCAASHVIHEFPTREGLQQSGTFTVRTEHMLRVVTGGRGEGHLLFQGWEHPFVFEGAKVIVAGDAKELEGAVYNLEKIEDFAGNYEPVGAEFGAGEGLTGAWGKNEKGVMVYVRFHNQDIEINKEAAGLKVTLQ